MRGASQSNESSVCVLQFGPQRGREGGARSHFWLTQGERVEGGGRREGERVLKNYIQFFQFTSRGSERLATVGSSRVHIGSCQD